MKKVLIVGAGYLSDTLIPKLLAHNYAITATSRDRSRRAALKAAGAQTLPLDLAATDTLARLEPDFSAVIYSVAPGRGGDRRLAFRHGPSLVLDRVRGQALRSFILTSSIGVYHREDGDWVDEDSQTRTLDPKRDLLEGEEQLRQRCSATAYSITILRLAGLYGPGRSPLNWVVDSEKRERLSRGHPDGFVNWVRIEDVAEAILQTLNAGHAGSLYNVVDNEPVRRQDFYDEACRLAGCKPLKLMGSKGRGKRVRNQRLRRELQWKPRYPTFREGLRNLAYSPGSREHL